MTSWLKSLVLIALCAACDSFGAEQSGSSQAPRCGQSASLDDLDDPEAVWTHEFEGGIFFSPREADLDGDGKLEILIMGGEDIPPSGVVAALDGETGAVHWSTPTRRQMYGSPITFDVNADAVEDVFIGGRSEEFVAIDGQSGEILWQFEDADDVSRYGFYNFYTAARIDDVTADGLPDLLVANGGVDGFEPGQPRPPGHLMVLDSKTGAIVAFADTPDDEETYMSALFLPEVLPDVLADGASGQQTILFGTGGETRAGGLWVTTLDAVLNSDISGAEQLVAGDHRGVVAPPSFADFNGDGQLDFVVAVFDGQLIAFDGVTFERLWEASFVGSETYSSPTLGYFNGDDVPDVFGVYLEGQFPEYERASYFVVDGADGAVLWQEAHGHFAQAGDLAVDLSGDDKDEVLFLVNDWDATEDEQQSLRLLDLDTGQSRQWGAPLGPASAAAPWTGDLDADGCLDLVVPRRRLTDSGQVAMLTRYKLPAAAPEAIRWGGYLGTNFDAVVPPRSAP